MGASSPGKIFVLALQMLVVAFDVLVLVPLQTGLNPSIAQFTAGLGAIVFRFITKIKVQVFWASSFAFIAPIPIGIKEFAMTVAVGINTLIRNKTDLRTARNLALVAVILVFGIGDMALGFGKF